MDMYSFVVILHLIGAVLGAGGASAAAMIFSRSIADLRLSREEISFMRGASLMVWTGLLILVVSGIYLAWASWDHVSVSPKFWAKQTIVGILFINGLFLNLRLMPRFVRHEGKHLPSSDEFMRYRHEVFISGGISGTSWYAALILGALRNIPYSYGEIMSVYALALIVVVGAALLIGHRLFERTGI